MTILPDGWYAPTPEKPWHGLETQLHMEVGAGHVLKGLPVRLIARRLSSDDALFALEDGRVAEVHMTWRPDAETNPTFPATQIFRNFDEWLMLTESAGSA